MASKLEKAQIRFEQVLRELGERAEMVDQLDQAEAQILSSYRRAQESVADRQLELDLIIGEIGHVKENYAQRKSELEESLKECQATIKSKEKLLGVKKSKVGPISKKLAGGNYDFRFIEKSLALEQKKANAFREREEPDRAEEHEKNAKRIKTEILKRKKAMNELKRDLKELERVQEKIGQELEELNERLYDLEDQEEELLEKGPEKLTEELSQQKAAKEKDLVRCQQHLRDVLADVGEDLYDKHLSHPVLSKYYIELDNLVDTIEALQE